MPLSDDARAHMKVNVDRWYSDFLGAIAGAVVPACRRVAISAEAGCFPHVKPWPLAWSISFRVFNEPGVAVRGETRPGFKGELMTLLELNFQRRKARTAANALLDAAVTETRSLTVAGKCSLIRC